eukprot:TRINITY_DN45549_c0_g1_i1.p1 TRINITY_DN45549_c0_g1~~TRINITY_DN45549_c0_g1_i1.p1  ORF type:complete len:398 (-),score=57.23 TRINITY_DN45549_c0_g1_i1:73-1170(-)
MAAYGGRQQQFRLQGTLREWEANKACGYIECLELPEKKIFAHKSEFIVPFADHQPPPVGSLLSFIQGVDGKSGRVRAVGINIERAGPGFDPRYGHFAHYGMPYGGAFANARLEGQIHTWDNGKGCGFITCPEMPGKKLFAHKSEFAVPFSDGNEPPIGTAVNFVMGMDARSGKERARDIQIGRLGRYDTFRSFAGGPMTRYHGTLEEWSTNKACGFILCQVTGKKVFAHKKEFVEAFEDDDAPTPGTQVSFILGIDAKSGRERAQQIEIGDGAELFSNSTRLQGALIEWREEKGCGFIECERVAGKKLFAHKSEFVVPFEDGEEPPLGTMLSFVCGVDKKSGRARAQQIEIADEADAPPAKRKRF